MIFSLCSYCFVFVVRIVAVSGVEPPDHTNEAFSHWLVIIINFDIVRILTAGGPRDMTHLFATYAFQVGIQSGDIPLGAADSLFMFPILAFAAFYLEVPEASMSAAVAQLRAARSHTPRTP